MRSKSAASSDPFYAEATRASPEHSNILGPTTAKFAPSHPNCGKTTDAVHLVTNAFANDERWRCARSSRLVWRASDFQVIETVPNQRSNEICSGSGSGWAGRSLDTDAKSCNGVAEGDDGELGV